jgi:hypothetical protein
LYLKIYVGACISGLRVSFEALEDETEGFILQHIGGKTEPRPTPGQVEEHPELERIAAVPEFMVISANRT